MQHVDTPPTTTVGAPDVVVELKTGLTLARGPRLNAGERVALSAALATDLIAHGQAFAVGPVPPPGVSETAAVTPTHTAMTHPPTDRMMPSPKPNLKPKGAR